MRVARVASLMAAALLMIAGLAFAQGGAKKADMKPAAKPAMSTFLIEAPHTAEECLSVLDATDKMHDLEKWQFGCMYGNHTAYRVVQATDETAALAMVPESVRSKATAHKVTKMTPAMLAAAHKAH
jgi:hypothetical protein